MKKFFSIKLLAESPESIADDDDEADDELKRLRSFWDPEVASNNKIVKENELLNTYCSSNLIKLKIKQQRT